MMKKIDLRGRSCPFPVIETKKYLEQEIKKLYVLLDSTTARGNVSKLAHSYKYSVNIKEEAQQYCLYLEKGKTEVSSEQSCVNLSGSKVASAKAILITSELLGQGCEELGKIIIRAFLYALAENDVLPEQIFFLNSRIKLTVKRSPVLSILRELEEKGVEILVCGTCLDYYNLKEKLAVGKSTNMYDIAQVLMLKENIIL